MSGGEIAPCGCADCRGYDSLAPQRCTKPTIKLRIRVGVSASGEWSAVGGSKRVLEAYTYGAAASITDDLANVAEEDVAAWHWITAEVPMPEVEQGETRGEVEHG